MPLPCSDCPERERGNVPGLVVGNRKREKKFIEIPFCKKINIYLFINMQKTHTEMADGQKCHGVKIGEGGGVVKNTKKNKVYNILTVL